MRRKGEEVGEVGEEGGIVQSWMRWGDDKSAKSLAFASESELTPF